MILSLLDRCHGCFLPDLKVFQVFLSILNFPGPQVFGSSLGKVPSSLEFSSILSPPDSNPLRIGTPCLVFSKPRISGKTPKSADA